MLLETIVKRDGQSIDQAMSRVQAIDPSLSRSEAESILAAVPERVPRPRPVPLDVADLSNVSTRDDAEAPLMEKETVRLSIETSRIVRGAIASLPDEDRTIVRCHFGTGMSVADIARMLRLPQRPLYRRIESITAHLRRALIDSGIDTRIAGSLIGSSVQALDFGLTGKTELAPQSDEGGGPAESGTAR